MAACVMTLPVLPHWAPNTINLQRKPVSLIPHLSIQPPNAQVATKFYPVDPKVSNDFGIVTNSRSSTLNPEPPNLNPSCTMLPAPDSLKPSTPL
jgi:hypothetical protein